MDAVTRFAAAIANAQHAAEIEVPSIDVDGRIQSIGVVLGPASQLFHEPVVAGDELEDEEFVARIDAMTEQLVASSGIDPTPGR